MLCGCVGSRARSRVIRWLAGQLSVHHEALRNWIRQAEADAGERTDRPASDLLEKNRRLLKEER